MRDVIEKVEAWRAAGEPVAIATVVGTWGSSPRPPGAKLALTSAGAIAGSVSAGCVEAEVIDECGRALRDGRPRLLRYGVSDDAAIAVGLACGGDITILAEPLAAWASVYAPVKAALDAREPFAVVSVLRGAGDLLNRKLFVARDGAVAGDLGPSPVRDAAAAGARRLLDAGMAGTFELEGNLLFADVTLPSPRLVVVGAVHIAQALVPMAGLAGFDTVVVDPRSAFLTRERFPDAGRIVKEWPAEALAVLRLDAASYVAVLTHDPKLDDPALQAALASPAAYVGALGSRRTHEQRLARLRAAGVAEAQLTRVHGPIGLPLGGRSPGEIAVSILAQVVQTKARGPAAAATSPGPPVAPSPSPGTHSRG
jgi:xanthine dehydrogenase accessory factor